MTHSLSNLSLTNGSGKYRKLCGKTVKYKVSIPSNTKPGNYNINGYITTNAKYDKCYRYNIITVVDNPPQVKPGRIIDSKQLTIGSVTGVTVAHTE